MPTGLLLYYKSEQTAEKVYEAKETCQQRECFFFDCAKSGSVFFSSPSEFKLAVTQLPNPPEHVKSSQLYLNP